MKLEQLTIPQNSIRTLSIKRIMGKLNKENIKYILVLTETRAFGCSTCTSRAQVSTPMDKFQLQVCPKER